MPQTTWKKKTTFFCIKAHGHTKGARIGQDAEEKEAKEPAVKEKEAKEEKVVCQIHDAKKNSPHVALFTFKNIGASLSVSFYVLFRSLPLALAKLAQRQ